MPTKRNRSIARVLRRRTVFRGKVFFVTSETVIEPGAGAKPAVKVRRDIVRHPGSVVVLAVDDGGREPRVLLERQYRFAAKSRLWELPAGRIDAGERPLAAAKRELLEETGYTATRWKPALRFWSSPGFLDEQMAIYLAQELHRGKAQPEEDEVIAKRFCPLSAATKMVTSGQIRDAKTIAGILWLATIRGHR
jgi:ADP-ribose pyrophosphatase